MSTERHTQLCGGQQLVARSVLACARESQYCMPSSCAIVSMCCCLSPCVQTCCLRSTQTVWHRIAAEIMKMVVHLWHCRQSWSPVLVHQACLSAISLLQYACVSTHKQSDQVGPKTPACDW